ncbi:MAG: NAD(P)/FAD-dependent oxidoreductase [Pseudomonadota bacterium]|nr:NAD(P)/FAD-dependent oxidoreductase [Pseudomonadota bacterium]
MTAVTQAFPASSPGAEHVDVLIVGAGISGIDAAYHVQKEFPGKSFVVLETQETFGGTWHTHKYPGVRSDSDLYTFGFKWKPWVGAPIATAEEIKKYLNETLDEQGLRPHIRYRHKVKTAQWSTPDQRWTVTVERLEDGALQTFTCNFLWMCQGYYRHEQGYTPEWPGMDRFKGVLVHPQRWPEDLDYRGKKVVVIGSGATAATIVPAMAKDVEHITMLQRSPTYFTPGANRNELADLLRDLDVPAEWIHEIVRRKVLKDTANIARLAFEQPEALKQQLIGVVRQELGEDYDVDTHFTPKYMPWRQRLAFVPNGDLFEGIRSGKASVATGHIESFNEKGVLLQSGEQLDADIIVTATGFDLCVLGDVVFEIDGEPVDFADTVTYRGCMFSGVPNMAWIFGYFRASWTLRADLVCELVCRMFRLMDEKGAKVVTPQLRPEDEGMQRLPWIDPENFNPGYLARGMHLMPRQGDREPWIFTQDYDKEKDEFPAANLEDGSLIFT